MSREFNLIEEKWIKVMSVTSEEQEVSLSELLLHADKYKQLAGEMPAQDIAVERMILGLLYSVFSRVTASGEERGFTTLNDTLVRWKELWDLKKFPEQPLLKYFEKFHDRFWLFDDERPFYQMPEASAGTSYPAIKLNGAVSQSNHKERMFSERTGENSKKLTYAESARWLIYLNGFDDAGVKNPSPKGVGWLGQLGLIDAVGHNLFETFMLNLVLIKGDNELWASTSATTSRCPCWERESIRFEPKKRIPLPDNFSALMTLQSRLILLKRENGYVTGYSEYAGDYFEGKPLCEPMTIWAKKKDGTVIPQTHDASKQIWREFGSIMIEDNDRPQPGVIKWHSRLYRRYKESAFNHKLIRYRTIAVAYGDMRSSITNSFSDALTVSARLLDDSGKIWNARIMDEIKRCNKCAEAIDYYSKNLQEASGKSGKDMTGKIAEEHFYTELDPVFRRWLYGLYELDPNVDPQENEGEEYLEELRKEVKKIALKLGGQMLAETDIKTVREVSVKNDKKVYWAPKEYEFFRIKINRIFFDNRVEACR